MVLLLFVMVISLKLKNILVLLPVLGLGLLGLGAVPAILGYRRRERERAL